ncbi:serine hydrolase [Pseudomonas sp. RIT-PI-S]|uniref:serine hydrolase domain-containing protein n=1 Tax=Pseudomonas sp. RIT-PI-S TaxID=3035295 RepID=UPI0021D97A35|nr:serine hydrolase [Pseudomonas sp. RIT-PI-S]
MQSELSHHLTQAYASAAQAASAEPLMQGFPPALEARVTWHNFMRPPYNRWAFKNLGRIRPSITVRKGGDRPSPLPAASGSLSGFTFESATGQQVALEQHLQATCTDGWLVMKAGQVVAEQYFHGHQAHKRHIMFSVTKSLIGLLAEGLILDGTLNPALPARHYVPEFDGSAFADASVRQLLDMAVAIDYDEAYDDPTSGASQFGYACGLTPAPAGITPSPSLYAYLPGMRKRGEHGGFFHYVTATTEALAWVMERASGIACAEQLEALWRGLGCERDGFFIADPWGRSIAGAGFNATLRDMARYGAMVLAHGQAQGHQLVPAAAIDAVLAGGDPAIYAANRDFAAWTPGATYKSQWYVYPGEALLAVGIHGQWLYVDFARDVVIVKQSSMPTAEGPLDIDTARLVRALAASL